MPESQQARYEERSWYLGVLLHALNQPLTAMASYAEAAGAGLADDADPLLREALSSAREETLRAIVIAREIRAVLGGREHLTVGAIDLNAVLSDVAPDLPSEAGVRVRLELDRDAGRVAGDALTLRRAVIALVKGGASRLAAAGDVTAVLRSVRTNGSTQAEVELLLDGIAPVPPKPSPPRLDPLVGLARSALADLGGELMLVAAEPGMLRYILRLAPA